jgi:hypothetical protein
MGHKVSHFFVHDIGGGIVHGVEDIGHVAKEGFDDVAHVVVHAGNDVAHVISYIPGVGPVISKGIYGITDIIHKGEQLGDWVLDPEKAAEDAWHVLSHPGSWKHELEIADRTLGSVAGDFQAALQAGAIVAPMFAPELAEMSLIGKQIQQAAESGNDLLHGQITQALEHMAQAAGGKVAKIAKLATAAVNVAEQVEKGNITGALEAAAPVLPAKMQSALKKGEAVAKKATAMAKKAKGILKKGQKLEHTAAALLKKKGAAKTEARAAAKRQRDETDYSDLVATLDSPYFIHALNPVEVHYHLSKKHPDKSSLTYTFFSPEMRQIGSPITVPIDSP